MNKKAFEFSFGWLFALLIGAFILFLAIYLAMNLADNLRLQKETEVGKDIGIILSPVETTLEEGKNTPVTVKQETIIQNDCLTSGDFGTQLISTKIKSGVGDEWRSGESAKSSFHNKYLFSTQEVYAKNKFYLISKPFEFPFKIADLIILWSNEPNKYCFVNFTGRFGFVESTISKLGMDVLQVPDKDDCPSGSIRVCPPDKGCNNNDIIVYDSFVQKNGTQLHYVTSSNPNDKYALVFAAIFSDPDIYECQIKRLMLRASALAETYERKAAYLQTIDTRCNFNTLTNYLNDYITETSQLARDPDKTSNNLGTIKPIAEDINGNNPNLCPLF